MGRGRGARGGSGPAGALPPPPPPALLTFSSFPCYALLSTFCFSASNIVAKKMLSDSSPEEVGFSLFTLTALGSGLCLMIGYASGASYAVIGSALYHAAFWKECVVLGSLTFLAHILMNRALSSRQVLFLLPFGAIRPLLSTWLGWHFFNEPWPTPLMWTGSLAMLLVMVLLSREQ